METFIFMRIQHYVLKIHQLCVKTWSDAALLINSPLAHHAWATIQCSPLSSYHYQKITPCRWYHYQVLLEQKIDYENVTSSLPLVYRSVFQIRKNRKTRVLSDQVGISLPAYSTHVLQQSKQTQTKAKSENVFAHSFIPSRIFQRRRPKIYFQTS